MADGPAWDRGWGHTIAARTTADDVNAQLVLDAVAAGRHVYLCPGALPSRAAWSGIEAAAVPSGALVVPGYWRLAMPHWQGALAEVCAGRLGTVRSVAVRLPAPDRGERAHLLALATIGLAAAAGGVPVEARAAISSGRPDEPHKRVLVTFANATLAIDEGTHVPRPALALAGDRGRLEGVRWGVGPGQGGSHAVEAAQLAHVRDFLEAVEARSDGVVARAGGTPPATVGAALRFAECVPGPCAVS
jgi:predicted dehydrogenase